MTPCTAIFLLKILEIPIESLDESSISILVVRVFVLAAGMGGGGPAEVAGCAEGLACEGPHSARREL